MEGIALDFLPTAPPRHTWLRRLGRLAAMLGVAASAWTSWLGVAAAEPPLVRVAVKPIPPFVYTDGPIPRGFSIDLWNEISEVIGVRTEFVVEETVQNLLSLAEEGSVDAAIAAVTINSDREALVDFSHPYYRSGLRIGVPLRHGPTLFSTIGRFLSLDLLAMLAMLATLTLVAAHLLWLIERGVNPECFPARYVSGVGEALWWSVATIITGGCENKAPVSLFGRLVAVAWMLGSIVLVAAFTATLSSQMTAESVAGAISGPDGLPGRTVATVRDSSAVKSLRNLRASVREFTDLAAAMAGVSDGKAEALVFDAPVLAHAVNEDPRSPIRLVGPLFEHQDYGIVLPRGSKLRKSVNQALLTLVEQGKIAELNVRWFGEPD